MPLAIVGMNRLSADIQVLLTQRGLIKDAVKLKNCYGYKQCHSRYCIKCVSLRAYRQRKHLLSVLPVLLATDPKLQLWFLTGAAADGPDVALHAKAAVLGMRRLLKHPRLKYRVVAYFAVLEVADKVWREHPCAHVHALIVTKPMDKGKYRISERDWVSMWEAACSHHRKPLRELPQRRVLTKKQKVHRSLVAVLVPRTKDDIAKVAQYCTKWANQSRIVSDYRRLLTHDPDGFLARIDALEGVPRFFGPLHKK